MLVALLDGARVMADEAQRVPGYSCPGCGEAVVLHQGRIRVHHYEHTAHSRCNYAVGETRAHLEAKLEVRDAFIRQEIKAELEYFVPSLYGDRRAARSVSGGAVSAA